MAAAALVLGGCGTGGTDATANTLSGLAVAEAPVQGTVSVKDASATAWSRPTATSTDGSFSVDVSGLTPPFLLKVEWTDGSAARRMYSAAARAGAADITPVTDAAVACSRGDDGEAEDDDHARAPEPGSFQSVLAQLRTVLAPLLDRYGVASLPQDGAALRALLRDVSFAVSRGTLTVTNRQTDAVIFTGPIRNLASGTFHPEAMPAGPGTVPPPPPPPPAADGAALYTQSCAGCHGALATSSKRGATAAQIQAAIAANRGGMGSLSGLTAAQLQAIASALATATPPPPPPPPAACTYTYSAWSACANGTQTRTVVSSSPAGCTGTPVLSQACTVTTPPPPPPPPAIDGAALYTQSCSGCHGALATSSKRGVTSAQIQAAIAANRGGMGSLSGLSTAQVDAIAAALK
ncbi:MAG: c-type cytochrome [Anaeromyxobacteraceae bacterium]